MQIDDKIKDLERKKQALQAKIQELEWQLANGNLSDSERRLKEQELIANKELLQELEKELGKLRNQSSRNPVGTEKNNKDNGKLNWVIGLGVAAVITIIFFRFLLLLRKRKR